MVIEMKFSINKYSQVFYRVGLGYIGLAKFIIIGQYGGFLGEGYNFSFTDVEFQAQQTTVGRSARADLAHPLHTHTDVEFHTVSYAPTLYRADVRLK
jgi:hypothetical protein